MNHSRARSWAVTAAVLCLPIALLAGCSGSDSGSGESAKDRKDPGASPTVNVTPTQSAGADFAPATGTPAGFRTFTSGRISIAVPGEWEEQVVPEATTARGEKVTTIGFRPRGGDPVDWRGLTVIIATNDRVGVLESSTVVENLKRDVERATDVTRRTVTWPGTTAAVVVEWTQAVQGTPVRYRQLMLQNGATDTVNVIGLTREGGFDGGEADQAMRTVVIKPASSTASG